MNRKVLSALLVAAAVMAVAPRGAMQSGFVLPAEIVADAASGPVRVIVRLAVPTVAEVSLPHASAISVQRAAIADAQASVLAAIAEHADAPTRFVTLPAFAVTTDAEGLTRLAASSQVVAIERDWLLKPLLQTSTRIVKADALWSHGVEGAGWSVAILDTGVERTHSFFQSRITSEACYSTNSPSVDAESVCPGGTTSSTAPGSGVNCTGLSTLFDDCEHGTLVAGVAAGRGAIINGVARAANIISIQVFSHVGNSTLCAPEQSCLRAFNSDIIRGLERVLELAGSGNSGRIGAVNLSAGLDFDTGRGPYGDPCDDTDTALSQAILNLRAVGIPVVVAAGNNSIVDGVSFPACMSSAIGVGATIATLTPGSETMLSSSNRSPLLKLVAPGAVIQTSGLRDSFVQRGFFEGTSLAAAHVSGGWTLLKSSNPTLSVDAMLAGLQQSGIRVVDSPPGIPATAYRRIDLEAAEGSMGPAGSPTRVIVTVAGNSVTASWSNPFDGSVPSAFRVEIRSYVTGATLANVDVGSNRSFFTTLQNGLYRMRVRAMAGGSAGPASSDVTFAVGTVSQPIPPLAPTSLRADVFDRTVILSWNLPGESTPATSFVVEAGSAPGNSNFGTFDTGSDARSATVTNVQPGQYWVRVRARNGFGLSDPSNEVTANVVGTGCVLPLPPTGLQATVVGSFVTINWAPPGVVGVINGYLIEVGTAPGLSNIASVPIPNSTVFSANAVSGIYYVRVRAVSDCGTTGPSNEVAVVVP